MKKVLLILSIPLLLISCGPKKTTQSEPAQTVSEMATEETTAPAAEADSISMESLKEGLVVYTSGDVFVTRNGVEEYLDIGDTLQQDDIVGTGEESYCEIQLGEIAVIRMEENSIMSLNSLMSTEEGSRIAVGLDEGQVLCKVKKLLEDDSFKVRAGTVVCGVRGTEFGVSAQGGSDVLLAVKEGAVSVTPKSLDQVSELAVEEEALKGVAAKIQEASFVVGASEEMVIEEAVFTDLEEIAPVIEEVVKRIEEKKNSAGAAGEGAEAAAAALEEEVSKQAAILLTAIEEKPEVIAPVVLEKKAISEESLKTLGSTDNMELISFTPPAATQVENETETQAARPVLPVLRQFTVLVEPAEANILANGKVLGKGKFRKLYADGKALDFQFVLDGYESQTLSLVVNESIEKEYTVVLEPEEDLNASMPVETVSGPVDIQITTEPIDASIAVDGVPSGTGSWTGQREEGSSFNVSIQRNGYASQSLTLTVASGGINRVIRLEPRPIEAAAALPADNFVGTIRGSGNWMIGADAKGKLVAFDQSGKVLWQYQSANTANANSSPVVAGNRVYFSGASEFAVLNKDDGRVIAEYPLTEDRSHIYGRQVLSLGGDILYPANEELVIMDQDGNETSSLAVPESSSMSPSVWNGRVVIADKKGSLLVLNPSSGETLSSIQTGSLQAVAQSPAIRGNIAVFSSRKGIVSAVDLETEAVLWERKLDRTVFASILAQDEGCYIYTTKQELFALSWETGDNLFAPMEGISSVPGYDRGLLYMTDESGMMKIVNAGSGRVEGAFDLQDSFSAKPIIRSGILFGVGANGSFYRINTAGIP